MNLSSTGIIYTFNDEQKRPLATLRRTKKGKILYILNRYVDMTENDKNIVRGVYQASLKSNSATDDIEDIEEFLSFSENKPCG